ncbi:MAG: sulfate transporter CysZ [Pseudoalteromonas spongiae]|uniref:Sulfate transporter CysZ n=1 Tax=Pseudoalteromonas spongiae TaxID=298657 RepID=A0ABU8EUM7_9GAMM|nr:MULTISPECIES: sulfate transporter CysZ [Pseudoalteromonas]KPV95370.1 Protein CysZ [Pseudoalteromonas sp. P1-9]MEC8326894.1 sulfate transporter CysZ [Pseudomonadota bacterium]
MQLGKGFEYFLSGFSLISQKGLKRFVLIPLLINLVLFGSSLFFIIGWIEQGVNYVNGYLPDFLSWLEFIIWPIALLLVLFIYSMVFTVITNFIAAPFNGLLSEKVELYLTGQRVNDDGLADLLKDVPRMLGRELAKLMYYLPKALLFLILLLFIPVFGQVMWFLFSAWMFAVQYIDYPFDNHKIPFAEARQHLKQKQGLSYGFGSAVLIFSMVPIVNLIVMPVAVCGATRLFVENYRINYRA